MKFLLDMPVSTKTMAWLRNSGFDAVHAREIGLAKASDTDILNRARREERIVITMDLDFPLILSLSQSDHPGVILLRLYDPRPDSIHKLLSALFQTYSETILYHSIAVIEDHRIRIRKLPIR